MDRKDFNVILCGKTSTGKTTIADILKNQGYKRNVSYTTRPIREGEENGKDYHFVSPEKFKELKDNDFFVETAAYDASFGHCEYGTAKKSFDTHGVFILNPEGLKTLSKDEALTKSDNTVVVFLDANEDVLRKRAIKRGDEIKEIDRRLKTDKEDFRTIYATLETYSHYLCFNTGSQMYNSPDKVLDEEISDIDSGLNYKRQKRNNLLDEVMDDKIDKIYITSKDRFIRFGYGWLENLCKKHGKK